MRADVVDRALEFAGVDAHAENVAVAEFAEGAAGGGLRTHVADARTGGDAGETAVSEEHDTLGLRQIFEGGGDLVSLGHAGSGTKPDEDDDLALAEGVGAAGFDRDHRGGLGAEDAGGAFVGKNAVGIEERGVDGGALHECAFGGEVAAEERNGAGHADGAGGGRREDHAVGIDAVELAEFFAETGAALGFFPPREIFAEGLAGDGEGVEFEQAEVAQVEHQLGDAAGEEDLHGGEVRRAVGEDVDEAGDEGVDARPVVDGGAAQAGGVGDGGDVDDEVGRAADGGVGNHGVVQ